MSYSFLDSTRYELGNYAIVPYRKEDMFEIMHWRNEQMDVLRQKKPLTEKDQHTYFSNCIEKSFRESNPTIALFSYLHHNICIGYGGLTNMNWEDKRCELSFLLSTKRVKNDLQYSEDFRVFIELMKIIAFEKLNFNRIYTETYDIRPLHISILEQQGFLPEGRMREHVRIDGRFVDSLLHGITKSHYGIKG
jgi:Acetyltransferase (GNAT) domain